MITRFNGGAGQVALNGALALPDGDYERAIVTGGVGMDSTASSTGNSVLYGDDAVANAAAGDLTPAAHAAGMEIVQVGPLVPQISPRDDMAALRTLTRVLADGRYDVVHTHSAKGGVIGRVAAARAGVPRIVHTWHGFPFNEFQSWARRRVYRSRTDRREAPDAFLAIGSETVTTALRLGLTTPERVRLSWWPWTWTPTRPRPAPARRPAALDLPLGVKVVGSIGRLTFQKGPEVFARAIARLPDDVFGLWVGGGPMADELEKLTAKLGIAERMRWLGHRDDVADVLPAFDVMAMASRWEGCRACWSRRSAPGFRWSRRPSRPTRTSSSRVRRGCWCGRRTRRARPGRVRAAGRPGRRRPNGRTRPRPRRRMVLAVSAPRDRPRRDLPRSSARP